MKTKRQLVLVLATLLTALTSTTVFAVAETNVTSGLTIQGPGLAVHGYDVVAYFNNGRPAVGSAEHSTVFEGATYRFASQQHLETFERAPEKYVPQYGGYCAYGVAAGAKFDGDPQLWRIVDGKLYLNLNQEIQSTWEKDVAGNILKADRNWRKIAGKSPSDLK